MENKRVKGFSLRVWARRLFFGPAKELNFLEEEQVQSPMRSMIKRFLHNKVAMTGVTIFVACLLLVIIGPIFLPLDLSFSDATQQNVPPTMSLASPPKALLDDVKEISAGTTYGIGCTNSGEVYTWGYTKITSTIDLANIPDEVKEDKIVQVSAGFDHCLALGESGKLYVWGNKRLGQGDIPKKAQKGLNFVQVEAGNQYSAALTDEGYLYLWGNGSADVKVKKEFQNHIKKVALGDFGYVSLMDDGSVKYTGYNTSSAYANIPEALSGDVVDIAGTSGTFVGIKSDGSMYFWGNISHNENQTPEYEGKVISIYGGRYHYTALLDNGDMISWGDDHFHQAFACVYAAFVGVFIYKELNWKTFVQALGDTTRDVGAVMFIIALSALFGYGVPIDKVPQKVAEIMLGITSNPHLVLVMIILMLTVVGRFMEGAATILILTPILLPVIKSIGIDPVHFGMIICTVVTMGNCTPPVGLSMYTVNSIIDCSLGEYTKEMIPWLATFLIAMAILAFFPAPFMWLQNVLY